MPCVSIDLVRMLKVCLIYTLGVEEIQSSLMRRINGNTRSFESVTRTALTTLNAVLGRWAGKEPIYGLNTDHSETEESDCLNMKENGSSVVHNAEISNIGCSHGVKVAKVDYLHSQYPATDNIYSEIRLHLSSHV